MKRRAGAVKWNFDHMNDDLSELLVVLGRGRIILIPSMVINLYSRNYGFSEARVLFRNAEY